jgi:hypothetical protein
MNVTEYLNKVAYIADSEIQDDDGKIYYSKFDKSYITRVGMEDNIKYLAKLEITDELTHGVGFSPKDNKWYGWSHRAIYGFEIGSTCKKGDCHYSPANKKDFMENCLAFWGEDEWRESSKACFGVHAEEFYECTAVDPSIEGAEVSDAPEIPDKLVSDEPKEGVWVHYRYNNKVPNEKLRGELGSHFTPFPDSFGLGEWAAKTLGDAKQMAIDFNEGVS